jgi:hypothetical protein
MSVNRHVATSTDQRDKSRHELLHDLLLLLLLLVARGSAMPEGSMEKFFNAASSECRYIKPFLLIDHYRVVPLYNLQSLCQRCVCVSYVTYACVHQHSMSMSQHFYWCHKQ